VQKGAEQNNTEERPEPDHLYREFIPFLTKLQFYLVISFGFFNLE